jgi:tRNA1Val (adenine37-N6)-methyltransferase
MMPCEELWKGGPLIEQSADVFRLGTDSALLSHFASSIRAKRAFDLGCGCGVLSAALAFKHKDLRIDAIDISEAAVALTMKNAERNNLSDRINVINCDIRRHRELFTAGAYDLVVSNPPYFSPGSGKITKMEAIAAARAERECDLRDIIEASAFLLRWGGSLALVYRPERLSEVFCAMTASGIEPKRLRMVQFKADTPPILLLLEGRRGGKNGLKIESPLIMTTADGSDSDEIKAIYRR